MMEIAEIIAELQKIVDDTSPLQVLVDGTFVGTVALVVDEDGEPYLEVREND